MTRLLFVHGISQEGKSSAILKKEWLGALNKGLAKAGVKPITSTIIVPFYGDELAARTRKESTASMSADQWTRGIDPDHITRSQPPAVPENKDFAKFAMEFAADALADHPTVALEATAIGLEAKAASASKSPDFEERGIENWPPIVHAIRVLEKAFPELGDSVIETFLKTVHCYLTVDAAFDAVNGIVNDALGNSQEATVVVGHSLGSVITYHVLHQRSDIPFPLYITLGSPLAVGAVRRRLRIPPKIPGGVAHWYNAFDDQDIVALHPLDRDNFLPSGKIENNPGVKNKTDNHHGIIGYLDNREIARRIHDAAQGR